MRRGLLILLLAGLLLISFLVRSVSTLLSLLLEDASADAIHRAELPSPNSSMIEHRPQIIPKIIHQTYKNETIPEIWKDAQQSCIDLHPDYEYIVRVFLRCVDCADWFSSGQTRSRATSSPRNIRGSLIPSTTTNIRSNVLIPFDTSS